MFFCFFCFFALLMSFLFACSKKSFPSRFQLSGFSKVASCGGNHSFGCFSINKYSICQEVSPSLRHGTVSHTLPVQVQKVAVWITGCFLNCWLEPRARRKLSSKNEQNVTLISNSLVNPQHPQTKGFNCSSRNKKASSTTEKISYRKCYRFITFIFSVEVDPLCDA